MSAHVQAAPVATQQLQRRPKLCFACGKPRHWREAKECTANGFNNKLLSELFLYQSVDNHHANFSCDKSLDEGPDIVKLFEFHEKLIVGIKNVQKSGW